MLVYVCRRCQNDKDHDESCVYSHQIAHIPTEDTMEIKDIATDPSLPRYPDIHCPVCGKDDPVFFQSTSSHPDTKMALYFVCSDVLCAHRWTAKNQFENRNTTKG
ncbi:DNA-directed RNA polymerase II core subunit rpb9 [Entomophthora muscae]|nr:DNA-directed RNA polymerase II core subunit rpb9 [Entomophthora muscae]